MLLRALTSLAVVASAAAAADTAFVSLPGLGLARRADPVGYRSSLVDCQGQGETCADVCGADYDRCPMPGRDADVTHCFKPASEKCCEDGSGHTCGRDDYCARDTSGQNWCCGKNIDPSECAAKNGVRGGLTKVTPAPPPPPPSSSSSSAAASSAPPTTASAVPETTSTLSSSSSSSSISSFVPPPAITEGPANKTTVALSITTTVCPSSSPAGYSSSAWAPPLNATTPTGPASQSGPVYAAPTTSTVRVSGAASAGASSLLLLLAASLALL
ncbi:hypothetical protein CDD83_10898 [Cordyceps sp. RAO-2017]|nr:hypothetical protein CDD83_10898 [Cordyceps sp. RAO-2017]